MAEELGIESIELQARGKLTYRADVGSGLIEHEEVTLFRGDCGAMPRIQPNLEEVEAVDWVTLDTLAEQISGAPERFTPWLRLYMAEYRNQIERV